MYWPPRDSYWARTNPWVHLPKERCRRRVRGEQECEVHNMLFLLTVSPVARQAVRTVKYSIYYSCERYVLVR